MQTYAQLKRTSIQELAEPDLVIATYRMLHSPSYLERLTYLVMGSPRTRPSLSPASALDQVLDQVLDRVLVFFCFFPGQGPPLDSVSWFGKEDEEERRVRRRGR